MECLLLDNSDIGSIPKVVLYSLRSNKVFESNTFLFVFSFDEV